VNREELAEVLEGCRGLRVGVLGDFALDAYWHADMTLSTLSREAPLFTRPIVHEDYAPGAGANVARLLSGLGAVPVAFSILGADWRGDLLLRLLDQVGVDRSCVSRDEEFATTLFAKVLLGAGGVEQEDPRLDFTNPRGPARGALERLSGDLAERSADLDGLLVSDYADLGVMRPVVIETLRAIVRDRPSFMVAVDSRMRIGSYPWAARKPNRLEATRWLLPDRVPAEVTVSELADALSALDPAGPPAFVTLGGEGCLVASGGNVVRVPVARPDGAIDPVGAGDAFLATLGACLASGAPPIQAAGAANLAAGVTVRKLGETGVALPAEILDLNDAG
jgi:rfaE bifunctional protein kinase chain/domain